MVALDMGWEYLESTGLATECTGEAHMSMSHVTQKIILRDGSSGVSFRRWREVRMMTASSVGAILMQLVETWSCRGWRGSMFVGCDFGRSDVRSLRGIARH